MRRNKTGEKRKQKGMSAKKVVKNCTIKTVLGYFSGNIDWNFQKSKRKEGKLNQN